MTNHVQPVRGNEKGEMTLLTRLLRIPRDILARDMFRAVLQYCKGDVLDVGGWDFFRIVRNKKGLHFTSWITLECCEDKLLTIDDPRFRCELGDGCNMPQYHDHQFDTVLNIQVLEHVMKPLDMMKEIGRVLKPGGHAILLVPQTGYMHMAPHHYYNFTRFWLQEAVKESGMEIVELNGIGGLWSSMGMHTIFFFLETIRLRGFTTKEVKRPWLFYPLLPLMIVYALITIPICFFLSLGDLKEASNNHLVIARKKH